jgi:2-keto-3-deoxy-6-phosphogluconate aldolase
MTNIIKQIIDSKIYGVVRADETARAVEIANAYAEAGIKVIELNSTLEAVQEVAKNKDIIVATGGIITTWQAQKALEAGSKLLVSPILQMGV